MKYFMTDIHGEYKGMEALFQHAGIDFSRDQLVIGGDMINRGKQIADVIKRVKALMDAYSKNVFAVIGNHEEMMRDYYQSGDKLWMSHGGYETIEGFGRTFINDEEREGHIEWASNLPLLFEDDGFVYTHAGLNPNKLIEHQDREILWIPEGEFYSLGREDLMRLTGGKPIVHGHTPVERIYFDGARINCDLGSNTYFIKEERGLALVNLTLMEYFVYKPFLKRIEKRGIVRF